MAGVEEAVTDPHTLLLKKIESVRSDINKHDKVLKLAKLDKDRLELVGVEEEGLGEEEAGARMREAAVSAMALRPPAGRWPAWPGGWPGFHTSGPALAARPASQGRDGGNRNSQG